MKITRFALVVLAMLLMTLLNLAFSLRAAEGIPDIATESLTLQPEGGAAAKLRWEKEREYEPTKAMILVRNPQASRATVLLSAWLNDGKALPITRVKGPKIDLVATTRDGIHQLDNGGRFQLEPKSLTPVELTFAQLTRSSGTEGRLALSGPDVPTADVIPITIEQPTPLWYLWLPLLAGLTLTAIIVLARRATLGSVGVQLPAQPQWNFRGSWASDVVVVSAVVTAVLGAIGSLGSAPFGDFSIARFVALNLVFGGLVLVAPLTYAALRTTAADGDVTKTVGTINGFLIACGMTLWAAFGQLLALFLLVLASPHSLGELLFLAILLTLSAVVLALYAWRTIEWTVRGYIDAAAEQAQDEAAERTRTKAADAAPEGEAVPIIIVQPPVERRISLL